MPYRLATPAKMVAERRVELLISRLSIECFEPAKLLRSGAEKRNRTSDLLRAGRALFQLSYFGVDSGADGRTRTCDELGVGEPIEPLANFRRLGSANLVRMGRLELPSQASEACALSVELHARKLFGQLARI